MMNSSSFLPLLLLLLVATAVSGDDQDAEIDYNYPTLKEVNDALSGDELDTDNMQDLPAYNSIWAERGLEGEFDEMPKAVQVVFQCPEETPLPQDFPTDVMFELLADRLNSEPLEKKYKKYKVKQKMDGIGKIEKMTGNLEYDLGINLDDYNRRDRRDLQSQSNLRGGGHRLLGDAKCPECNKKGGCEASFCMAVEKGRGRRLPGKGKSKDSIDTIVEKELDAVLHLHVEAEMLKKAAQNEKKDARHDEDELAEEVAERKEENTKDMKAQAELMEEMANLRQNNWMIEDNLNDLMKDDSKEGVEKFVKKKLDYKLEKLEDKLEYMEKKAKDDSKAKEEEEKRQKELEELLKKYQKEWDKAAEKIEGFADQVKAAGVMEEALRHVVEWFDEVYDVDCYVRVVRLA